MADFRQALLSLLLSHLIVVSHGAPVPLALCATCVCIAGMIMLVQAEILADDDGVYIFAAHFQRLNADRIFVCRLIVFLLATRSVAPCMAHM